MCTPNRFTPLQHLSLASGFVNVIGVVVDYLPPCPTRGSDWQCAFNLVDKGSTYEGQRVKMFLQDQSKSPPIRGTGDVVILRNIQLKNYLGANVLLSNWQTQWTVFHCSEIPKECPVSGEVQIPYIAFKDVPKPNVNDMLAAIDLCNIKERWEWTSKAPNPEGEQASGVIASPQVQHAPLCDKFSLIENIGANQFFDLVGQVVKMYGVSDRLDLSITDYTENSLLYNYDAEQTDEEGGREGDQFGYLARTKKKRVWSGPSGKYTLTVTLFRPHSSFAADKIREGDYIFLRNIHIKIGRDGSCRLEGALHTDKKFPERIDVQKLSPQEDERVKALLRRKKHFQKKEPSNDARSSGLAGLKRPPEDSGAKDLSKSQLKRQRRKQREAEQKEQQNTASLNETDKTKADRVTSLTAKHRALLEENKHIACMHPDKPSRRVAAINAPDTTHLYGTPEGKQIILPFQNLVFRTKVRVVDFYPPNLEDFAVRTSEYDCLEDEDEDDDESSCSDGLSSSTPPSSSSCSSNHNSPSANNDAELNTRKRWTWFFTLLVEDASDAGRKVETDRMAIQVADEDAEFLLNLTAVNLRRRGEVLAQLREKLFILWGDLEEQKTAAADAKPGRDDNARPVLRECDGNAKRGKSSENDFGGKEAQPCKPFVCCVKEYGIKRKGEWRRRFRMFGTSIQ